MQPVLIYSDSGNLVRSYFGAVGVDGKPVERTKAQYPYSYDTFIVWRTGPNSELTHSVYTDRMQQWEPEKFELLRKKYNKQFPAMTPAELTNYMCEYIGKQVEVIYLAECCNHANGFPLWLIGYKELK